MRLHHLRCPPNLGKGAVKLRLMTVKKIASVGTVANCIKRKLMSQKCGSSAVYVTNGFVAHVKDCPSPLQQKLFTFVSGVNIRNCTSCTCGSCVGGLFLAHIYSTTAHYYADALIAACTVWWWLIIII